MNENVLEGASMTIKSEAENIEHIEIEKKVLRKALINACHKLEITPKEFGDLMGVKGSSYSRFIGNAKDHYHIDPNSKNGEAALMFLNIYKALFAINGGDLESCRVWLRTKNKSLGNVPIEMMASMKGMVAVLYYLERIKG
jgi:hypothetical protein